MAVTVPYEEALRVTAEIFIHAGFLPEYAAAVADNLVSAEGRGVYSHGLVQVKPYVERFKKGLIKNTEPTVLRESLGTATVDAHKCPGAVAGNFGMRLAIKKARETGIGAVAVQNGTHFGMAYHYGKLAAAEGMIGLAFTNAGDLVAPFGGKSRQLGTNPICIVSPVKDSRPVAFDAATSVQAFNKVFHASVENKPIPLGWAMDKDGHDTTDPFAALEGCLLPFGGYKGYGVGFMINILTGFLSGSSVTYTSDGQQREDICNTGFFFVAIDISKFVDFEEFTTGVKQFVERVKSSPKQDGVDEIFVPGEIEYAKDDKAHANGIILDSGVAGNLLSLCDEYKIKAWE